MKWMIFSWWKLETNLSWLWNWFSPSYSLGSRRFMATLRFCQLCERCPLKTATIPSPLIRESGLKSPVANFISLSGIRKLSRFWGWMLRMVTVEAALLFCKYNKK